MVGYASSSVTACYNTGSILGSSYVGGVVGYSTNYSSSSITACYNTGAVDGNGDNYYAGGVAGYASSYLYGCYYLPYSDMSYTSSTDGTADENLVATMTSSDFPATLNEAAGDDYFEFDSYNYNGGYPILISIDYSAIGD
ncbi:MAG: GLUG motif-containing protein [Rikenellaceae bacterium]